MVVWDKSRSYRPSGTPGERRKPRALVGAFLAVIVLGGCSISLPVAKFSGISEETTGSIGRSATSPLAPDLAAEDWRRARGALAVALDPQGNGTAVAWDNPETGYKGTFSPVGSPFVKGDEICRAFLASYIGNPKGQTWLQGSACRPSGGEWAIVDVKPWKKPT